MSDKYKIGFIKSVVEGDGLWVRTTHSLCSTLYTTKNHPMLRCKENGIDAIRLDHWPESWGKVNTTWVKREYKGPETPPGGPYGYDTLFGVERKLPKNIKFPATAGECRGYYNQGGLLFMTAEYVIVPETFILERIQ